MSSRQASLAAIQRNSLVSSSKQASDWATYINRGYSPLPEIDPGRLAGNSKSFDPVRVKQALSLAEPATPNAQAARLLALSFDQPTAPNAADSAWRTVRRVDGPNPDENGVGSNGKVAGQPPTPSKSQSKDLFAALKTSGSKAGVSEPQIQNLLRAFTKSENGVNFLNGLSSYLPKDQAHLMQSVSAYLQYKGYEEAKEIFKGNMSFSDLTTAVNTPQGAAGLLYMTMPFLPKQEQRFSGVAAGYLSGGNMGAIRGALAFLPPKYQKLANLGLDIDSLNPSDLLGKWVGQLLPQEAQALFSAVYSAGGIGELLSVLKIPDVPLLKSTTSSVSASGGFGNVSAKAASAGGVQPFAARITDRRSCSAGVGTIIGPACLTVKIGGFLAARMGDTASCTSPVPIDVIRSGEPTVLIGGAQAARMGDPMAHGMMVASGCPTVLIGKVYTGTYGPSSVNVPGTGASDPGGAPGSGGKGGGSGGSGGASGEAGAGAGAGDCGPDSHRTAANQSKAILTSSSESIST